MYKVILIANYLPDSQESMTRFAQALSAGLTVEKIENEILFPKPVLHAFHMKSGFLHKWLGYIDKFVLYPRELKRYLKDAAQKQKCIVHICDHSNTPYAKVLQDIPHFATCHDLTAIKSALGMTPYHSTRFTGKYLQRFIMRGIESTQHIVCVSEKTQHDLHSVLPGTEGKSEIIHNGLNYPYTPMGSTEAEEKTNSIVEGPFFLHVGGDSWYKNRIGVLHLFRILSNHYPRHQMLFVGPPPNEAQRAFIEAQDARFQEKVSFQQNIDNEILRALYSRAEALLFPSHEEGFGWPIVEAQACGCPAVVVDRDPMRAVAGDAGIVLPETPNAEANQNHWATLSSKIIITDLRRRTELPNQSMQNATRFQPESMLQSYIATYQKILNGMPQER